MMRSRDYNPHADPKTAAWAKTPPTRGDYEGVMEDLISAMADKYRERAYDQLLYQGDIPEAAEDDYDALEEGAMMADELAREWAEGDVKDHHYDMIVAANLPVYFLNRDPDFTAIYQALNEDSADPEAQMMMNDWLEDHGLDRFKFYFDPDEDHPRARPFDEQGEDLARTVFHPPPAGAMPTPSPGAAPTPKQSPAGLTQGGPNVVFPATDAMQRPDPARTRRRVDDGWGDLGASDGRGTGRVDGADPAQQADYRASTLPHMTREHLRSLTDEDLANSRFAPPDRVGRLNASVTGKALVGGKVAFYKGYDPELSLHEERMADLHDEAGVSTPAIRRATVPGAPSKGGGVIGEYLDAPSVADLVIPPDTVSFSYDDARRNFDEQVRPTLQPGELDRAVLASFLLGVEDRHLNNYLVKDGRIYSIDHEFGLFGSSKPLRPSIIARNKLTTLGWPSMDDVRFDPQVVGQMAAAAGRIGQKLAGTPEGDAVQLQGEALLRLMESGDTSLASLTKILKDMRTERPEV